MIFHGFQKLTLLDYPGRVACTLFTGGCNLRCPFCHNASLVLRISETQTLSEEEVLRVLRKRTGVLEGVCISGGEPLLQDGLAGFLRRVRELGLAIKLDTNGTFPDRLQRLAEDGLIDTVAMDLKNCPGKYAETVGIPGFDLTPIRESIAFLTRSALPHEFRTTIARGLHTPDGIAEAAQMIPRDSSYFLQNFVDSGDLIGEGLSSFTPEEGQIFLMRAREFVPATSLRGV